MSPQQHRIALRGVEGDPAHVLGVVEQPGTLPSGAAPSVQGSLIYIWLFLFYDVLFRVVEQPGALPCGGPRAPRFYVLGFRVQGFGFRVWGLGFRVEG